MHPPEVKQAALELIAAGHNDCEVSRRTGIPRRTIMDWRRPTYVRHVPKEACARCWRPSKPIRFTPEDYAELLAMYLGDGCISDHARTQRLRISLDTRYPLVIEETRVLLTKCFPKTPVDVVSCQSSCVNVSMYSTHLDCLFPQHGPGPKHLRVIELETWQEKILRQAPWPFIRGCIRTDGCAFVNRTGPYEYLSYDFSNMSKDIVALFLAACDLVEVRSRVSRCSRRGLWRVRINRRDSVARMNEHVGLKE
jgi:hypothetical protein